MTRDVLDIEEALCSALPRYGYRVEDWRGLTVAVRGTRRITIQVAPTVSLTCLVTDDTVDGVLRPGVWARVLFKREATNVVVPRLSDLKATCELAAELLVMAREHDRYPENQCCTWDETGISVLCAPSVAWLEELKAVARDNLVAESPWRLYNAIEEVHANVHRLVSDIAQMVLMEQVRFALVDAPPVEVVS